MRSEGDKSEECPGVGVVRCCPCPLALRVQQLVQRLADTNVKNLVFGLLPELLMRWLRGDPQSCPPLAPPAETPRPSPSCSGQVRNNNRNKIRSRCNQGLHSCTKLLL